MISVLLTILKIIGIILLSLLVLFMIILLLVLLVPARYQLKGSYKEELLCKGKVTWLLHFIAIYVDYNKELNTTIKIMGIPLSRFIKMKADKSSGKDVSSPQEENVQKKTSVDYKKTDVSHDYPSKKKSTTDKKTLCQKISGFITDIKNKIAEILNKLKNIIQNIKTKKETLEHYISILKSDEVKGAFSLCKKRIKKLFKHLLPKRMKVNAKIGFEDPSTTGYLVAGYSLLPYKFRKKIIIYPEFNEQIIEGDFYIKGYMNAWSLLYQILCVVFDKNCKSLFKIVKKEILDERK